MASRGELFLLVDVIGLVEVDNVVVLDSCCSRQSDCRQIGFAQIGLQKSGITVWLINGATKVRSSRGPGSA
jgi:hypothetical protein